MFQRTRMLFLHAASPCLVGALVLAASPATAPAQPAAAPAADEPIYLDETDPTPPPRIARQTTITEKYPDGSIRIERGVLQMSDDQIVNEGPYKEYYVTGQQFAEGQFKKGVHDGEWTFWHENGKVAKKVSFTAGKPDGSWEVFRADGTLLAKRGYKLGVREGTWITYFDDGKSPQIEQSYVNGKVEGERKTYHANGKVRQQAQVKDGQLDGPMVEFDEQGNKVGEAEFRQGKLNGKLVRYAADGTATTRTFEDGKPVPNK